MRVEAVSVCVGYHDFLAETVKQNIGLLDQWTIITSPDDHPTQEVCRKFNMKMIMSDDGKRFGEPFNKGRLVERALQHSSANGWRLHIDADIVLPHDFRHRLLAADLQEDMIYGVDRVLIKSWDAWQKVKRQEHMHGGQFSYHNQMKFLEGAEVGSRWCHPSFGYCPIGYFQLWHSTQDEWRGVRVKPYPQNHGNACRTDVQHALQWDRHKRAVIPEMVVVHLESEPCAKGTNWNGRTTKKFGPEMKSDCEAGYWKPTHHHHKHHHGHHHKHEHDIALPIQPGPKSQEKKK